eukprot:scaffold24476_cov62-Phaeocystis_antarctica.AAC.3
MCPTSRSASRSAWLQRRLVTAWGNQALRSKEVAAEDICQWSLMHLVATLPCDAAGRAAR